MTINHALLKASWRSWVSNDQHRAAGPYWLQWVWTVLFAAGLAVLFTLLGWLSPRTRGFELADWAVLYGRNLVVSLTVSATIHLLFDACRLSWVTPERLEQWNGWQRTLFFAGVPLLGVLLGWPLGLWLVGADVVRWFSSEGGSRILLGGLIFSVVLTAVLYVIFEAKARQYELEKRATEAQLRLLQAQIEPHFLFNTLANVQSLMGHDLPKAQQMLASFTDYLRVSLGALRQESAPLAGELDLARTYLTLLQGRMEDRLSFHVTADDASLTQLVPPLLLQPLVENAVVHGLEPSINGGHVELRARVEGDQLIVEVQDNGMGLEASAQPSRHPKTQNSGLALANIRERLLTRYGSHAQLELVAAQPGTLARITLPFTTRTP